MRQGLIIPCRFVAALRPLVRLLAMKVVTSMSPSAGVLALASADFELAEVTKKLFQTDGLLLKWGVGGGGGVEQEGGGGGGGFLCVALAFVWPFWQFPLPACLPLDSPF
jgi:hypothetical protein